MKAIDLMKMLGQDPDYIKMRQKKEEEALLRRDMVEKIEHPFIEDLQKNGFSTIKNISDLQRLEKIDTDLIGLILKWIPELDNSCNSKEVLIRVLKRSQNPVDGTLLIKLFEDKEASFYLKWAIADTIAEGQVNNVGNWIEEKLSIERPSKECEMLIYAVMRFFPYEKAQSIFTRLFKIFPLQIADAFTKIGRESDLIFLRNNNKGFDQEVQTVINDCIGKLGKRLKKSK